ncbi:aldehyde oxidase 1-like [Temnothorax americanus]|uniref:aldehyde oxidase 1-like n=1 Tax=Temnothorax americanus TaxID=1964332 RepID=UPI004067A8FC
MVIVYASSKWILQWDIIVKHPGARARGCHCDIHKPPWLYLDLVGKDSDETDRAIEVHTPGVRSTSAIDLQTAQRAKASLMYANMSRQKAAAALPTGEPPLCMSYVIPIAICNALNSARAEVGNTDEWYRLGVYRTNKKDLYIDINDISDLRNIQKTNQYLVLGGNTTLTMHVDLIANVPVRNIGSIAGNLMIKHAHNEFPSDMFLILETVGTQVHVLESPARKQSVTLLEFLKLDMFHKIIYSVVLPPLSDEYEYRSYKIMPTAQNAHAHVNAGFLFKFDAGGMVLEKPNIIYGGINKDFLHATNTELMLLGKSILNNQVLKSALKTLHDELHPDHVLPSYSLKFRTQDYDTNATLWPINEPITKLDAIKQTSGEAQYCNDLPPYPREVFCSFVVTKCGSGKIDRIDASKALSMEGVVAFFSAKDIPGKNMFISPASKLTFLQEDELLFVEEDILYAGQPVPVGVIVAKTHNLANKAAKLVKIKYSGSQTKARRNTKQVVKGVFQYGSQYHHTIETQSCVCVPAEDGMDVYPSSQWLDITQVSIANCLNVKNNSGCYATDSWTFNGFEVRTDLPRSNTYCRAPGSTEEVAMIENIMEHIAKVTKKDPVQVRLSNMNDVDKAALEITMHGKGFVEIGRLRETEVGR